MHFESKIGFYKRSCMNHGQFPQRNLVLAYFLCTSFHWFKVFGAQSSDVLPTSFYLPTKCPEFHCSFQQVSWMSNVPNVDNSVNRNFTLPKVVWCCFLCDPHPWISRQYSSFLKVTFQTVNWHFSALVHFQCPILVCVFGVRRQLNVEIMMKWFADCGHTSYNYCLIHFNMPALVFFQILNK